MSHPLLSEMRDYVAKAGVDSMVADAYELLVKEKPDDPAAFLAKHFAKTPAASAAAGADGQSRLPPRPRNAHGKFLRVISMNDVYRLENYAHFATAVLTARRDASLLDCKVSSHCNGDFLSPCILTSLDGGVAMMAGLNTACVDYACLGNHELDLPWPSLARVLSKFNGKCINSNLRNPELSALPRWDVFTVGEKSVVVAGVLTDDLSIYAPATNPDFEPCTQALFSVWEEAKAHLGRTPDLFLPMTHQLIGEDRDTAAALAKNAELKNRTPCLLAGHEHEVFMEEVGRSLIVKVGQDAEKIGVVDIWWTEDGSVASCVTMIPAEEFEPEPNARAYAQQQAKFLAEMMDLPIAQIPTRMTSSRVRFEESGMASFLLSMVKRGLRDSAVEVALIQGGAVRAGKEYEAGPFTMGDLFKEFGFPANQAIIQLPGSVIADSVRNSRNAAKPAPNFLHLDGDCQVTAEHEVTHLDGKPIDPAKLYTVSIYQFLLTGLNVIQPLLGYVQANVKVPDLELCRPVKDICMEVCMKDAWRQLIGFEFWDPHGESHMSPAELEAAVDREMELLDSNGDGLIQPEELAAALVDKPMCAALVQQMMKMLDSDGDGSVSRADLRQLAI